ncbi:phage gene 29 protein family protein [Nocardia arthritidis]|uniref:DUF2744 domain-containing protein n=1 Tax=Nocardia arthritidis TaxID=228602 RepID=A0A6G9YSW1_9NOCA|nr:DUF2744 domain-containing protein [Nocardia arthritidis]QIS16405.1 DUF2744 domain-containing protein [Nocardia arthritidis]
MRLPTQRQCDMNDPEEHLLWGLAQIAMSPTQPMLLQESIARTISKHLYECGFRHHPELQEKKLQAPHRGQQHMLNGSARWVPIEDPEPDPVELPDVSAMTVHEQEFIINQLKELGRIPEAPVPQSVAEITNLRAVRGERK